MALSMDEMARQMIHMEQTLTGRLQAAEQEIIGLRQQVANAASVANAAAAGGGQGGWRAGRGRGAAGTQGGQAAAMRNGHVHKAFF